MRVLRLSSLAVGLFLSGCAATRPAVSLDVPVTSRYVFRGAVLDDDPALQPSLSIEQELSAGFLAGSVWSNLEWGDDRNLAGEFTEVDYTVSYTVGGDRVDLTLGAARYEYPHTGLTGSLELFAQLAGLGLVLTPTVEAWVDVDEVEGTYLNLNLGHELQLSDEWTASLVAGLGWMDANQGLGNYGVESAGLSDVLLQVTCSRPLTDRLSLSLIGVFSSVLDGDYRDAADDPDNAWGAVGLSVGL